MNDREWLAFLAGMDEHDRELARSVVRRISFILDTTIEGRLNGNTDAIGQARREIGKLSSRVHALEDHFDPGSTIDQIHASLAALALELSTRQAKAAGDAG